MDYRVTDNGIIVSQNCFDLAQTLDCGQAFRWSRRPDGAFEGDFLNEHLVISQQSSDEFLLHGVSEEKFLGVWKDYFDLDTDYSAFIERFSDDETLSQAAEFASGIRILRQDPWETLCSFIISQNNNIPRIKGIIGRLCEKYSGFPDYSTLAEETAESLAFLRAGFRAKYIEDAAKRIASHEISLEKIKSMPTDDARKELMHICGVGPKVADCVLLFGMHRLEAFPVDVWMKKVMERFYPDGMPECAKGLEGVAQQYLFHYVRCNREKLI
ncbi:DNA glycosylase [Ruminococcus sp. HUN007]|uniref:DNA-3-methyladenine glycosylase family protein n=1 Tax=Ruminococcus sp. HUN007 TaxID=1514668 RepID=UPI0005D28B95|nr:DNA glycosylase [Ruminococcus sp. HUN007]